MEVEKGAGMVADMADDKFLFVCLFLAYMLLHKVAGIMAEKNILAVILMHMVADKVAGMVSDMGDDKKNLLVVLV